MQRHQAEEFAAQALAGAGQTPMNKAEIWSQYHRSSARREPRQKYRAPARSPRATTLKVVGDDRRCSIRQPATSGGPQVPGRSIGLGQSVGIPQQRVAELVLVLRPGWMRW